MKHFSIPAAALSVVMAASPLAAFAHTASAEESTGSNVQVNVHSSDTAGAKASDAIRGLFGANPDIKVRVQTNATTSAKRAEPGMAGANMKVHAGADAGIDTRIMKLNDVLVRLGGVKRLSDEMKASLTTAVTAQIDTLKNVRAGVDAQGTTTVKDDMNSTNSSFRAYALILPKAAVTAAADRVMTIVGQMEVLSVKMDARIDAATDADVSAARTALADFDAKVADAKVQAQAAVRLVVDVTVGKEDDKATFDANVRAFKDAKAKIDAAQADLKAARADVAAILKEIKGKGVKADASASVR